MKINRQVLRCEIGTSEIESVVIVACVYVKSYIVLDNEHTLICTWVTIKVISRTILINRHRFNTDECEITNGIRYADQTDQLVDVRHSEVRTVLIVPTPLREVIGINLRDVITDLNNPVGQLTMTSAGQLTSDELTIDTVEVDCDDVVCAHDCSPMR